MEEKGGQDLSILSYAPELEDLQVLEIEHWRYTDSIVSLKQIASCGPSGWAWRKKHLQDQELHTRQVSGNQPDEDITSGTHSTCG